MSHCKVINFVDYSLNQGAPTGHESAETPIGHESKSQEDNEALRIELAEAKIREEFTDARLHEVEGEMAQLREKEELEADYQKQVDEMYFFGYHCCMKKHGIKRDIPSIPPGEEDKLRGKPSQ
ncbi:hypothetical protein CK203_107196 [Vitis vinifera]|uniref:Uncharacterized protein n=1 Tax=Vitis vinifera TaxID=29760 RepID=A0A438DBK9_VITVI|nr:hypothetical protein CK203_107196 [Vitis vinifera]